MNGFLYILSYVTCNFVGTFLLVKVLTVRENKSQLGFGGLNDARVWAATQEDESEFLSAWVYTLNMNY